MRLGIQGHCFTQAAPGTAIHTSEKLGGVPRKDVLLGGVAAAAAELWNYLTFPRELLVLSYADVISVMKEREPADRPPTSVGRRGVLWGQRAHGSNRAVMLQRVVLRERGGGSQDRGDPQGCLVDAHALPTFQRARGMSGCLCTLSLTRGFLMPQRTSLDVNHSPDSGICCLADWKPHVQGALGLLRLMPPLPRSSLSHHP